MSLAAVLLAFSFTMYPAIEPVPGSTLTMEGGRGEEWEMMVIYRHDDRRRRRTVRGPRWYLEYDLPDEVTRVTIIDHFIAESDRLHGYIRREAGNRLTFSFLREDGGESWCQVWATDGSYSLEIVDEAPPIHEPFDDAPRPSATVVFSRGDASIDDDGERVLDSIANWLEVHPDVPAAIRGHRGPLEDPALPGERAKAVFNGIAARGISAERLQVSESDLSDPGFDVTVDAVAP
ncbi:MAG: hypothetical protein BMS9Abin37_2660 [Acidobacteriota bacterium]|nr:MAG: hypothetical protein BMS9Abin37_2660 [Acidobacteriota bacterium]